MSSLNQDRVDEIEKRLKEIQAQRVALLDKHGVFGGGQVVNRMFGRLNEQYDKLESELKSITNTL